MSNEKKHWITDKVNIYKGHYLQALSSYNYNFKRFYVGLVPIEGTVEFNSKAKSQVRSAVKEIGVVRLTFN